MSSRYLVPVGMTIGCRCSPCSISMAIFQERSAQNSLGWYWLGVVLPVVRMCVSPPVAPGPPLLMFVSLLVCFGVVKLPLLGSSWRVYTKRPARTSHGVLGDIVWVRWPNVMAGTCACSRRVALNGVTRVGGWALTQCSSLKLPTNCRFRLSCHDSFPKALFCS